MTEDVYEPLARYRDEFCRKFAALAQDKFDELARKSGVDAAANRRLVRRIGELEKQAGSADGKKSFCGCLSALAFAGAAVALVAILAVDGLSGGTKFWCIAGTAAGLAAGVATAKLCKDAAALLARLKAELASAKEEAWRQMEPLNVLYTWDMTPKLIEATVPRLAFDPYFAEERLASLHRQFGWDDSFNEGKSVVFAQSGTINGNPFVFGQYLEMEWGEKTYEGSLEISWTEIEEDEDGRLRRVRRHETLHASVKKPVPVYSERKMLIYGNDAAPDLSFTREPSGITDGLGGSIRKRWRLWRLKAHSRNLDDDSNFTLMGNHEFETWFHAKDRDDEVGFRLLFTPVAQMQMLALMKDKTVGYGDDFTFVKSKKMNFLFSRHLDEAVIDTDPARFRNWDYDAAKAFFLSFNERYFKDAYFSLAPLLAIPVYQQIRTHEDIWKGVSVRPASSFWEHEALANFHGESKFAHPDCITRSILKTRVVRRDGGESVVAVAAHGYCGVDRVDYKDVHGGDGRWHSVPVRWTEYLPVTGTGEICLSESETPSEGFRASAAASAASAYRRSIVSYLRQAR